MTLAEQKQHIRKEMRHLLHTQDSMQKQKLDAAVCRNVLHHPWVQQADSILCYYAMPDEPATQTFLAKLLAQGKQIALPACDTDCRQMHFFRVTGFSETDISPGAYGIPEPVGRQELPMTASCVMLVPALAFSKQGFRLGQGGGYYDRYLQAHPMLRTIGICYDSMLFAQLPCEPHDCRVSCILTDTESIYLS